MSGDYPNRDPQMFYELARERLAGQAALLDALDSKLALFLTGSSTLIGILVAIYALRPEAFGGWETVVAVASGAVWFLLTALTLAAFRPAKWLSGPKLQDVFNDQFSDETDVTLKWHVANHFSQDYDDNKKLQVRKVQALKWAQRLLISQTALLVAALFLVGRSQTETLPRSHTLSVAAHDAPVWVSMGVDRAGFALALAVRRRSSRKSLTASYAASGTARARLSPCASRARTARSA